MSNNQENSYLIKDNIEHNKVKESSNIKDITIICRNQLSVDTNIKLNSSKISTLKVSDISDKLLLKLNKSKSDSYIRFFFKGRPLKQEEKIKDLCNQIIKLRIQYNIIIYKL